MSNFRKAGARLLCLNTSGSMCKVDSLAIVAHSDDAEILAPRGIIESWTSKKSFGVVVVNDGVGRPRAAAYEGYSNEEMTDLRIREQFAAARAGGYSFALALAYPSSETKEARNQELIAELREVLALANPRVVYTHNPWDVHPSHISVLQHALWALSGATQKPDALFGGEVWGPLDRIPDPYLIRWDCTGQEPRLEELLSYFASQNAIKDYHHAVMDRRRSHAKLNNPHVTLPATSIHLGVDLTKVLTGELTLREFVTACDEAERGQRMARFIPD